jgi:hypothetical protein
MSSKPVWATYQDPIKKEKKLWFNPVIPATLEVKIEKIAVGGC